MRAVHPERSMEKNPLIGTILEEKYEILALAGTGGMGSVFKARQLDLERMVAIKILNPILQDRSEIELRFQREARVISQLNHEHIAAFYSFGITPDASPYIVMEFVEGQPLSALLTEATKLPWKRALKICRQIIQAMSYAHKQEVLHRDLKPENIILCDKPEPDYVKIIDFGLSKFASQTQIGDAKVTHTGDVIGSIHYLSPEQCRGSQTDRRSDIYALACVLYQMISGRPPFDSDNPVNILHKHTSERVELLSKSANTNLPEELDLIVVKALSKNPETRYQSMDEFDYDLMLLEHGRESEINLSAYDFDKKKKRPSAAKFLIVALSASAPIFAGFYFYCGSSTLYSKARQELKGKVKHQTLLKWLKSSDNLVERGEQDTARKIIQELSNAVGRQDRNPLAEIRLFLEAGELYFQEKKVERAAFWVKKSLLLLAKHCPSSATENKFAGEEFKSLVERASKLAIDCKPKFTDTQARELVLMARRLQVVYGEASFLELFSLIEEISRKQRIANPKEHSENLLALDFALSLHKTKSKELALRLPKTIECLARLNGPDSFLIARHYLVLADNLSKHQNQKLAKAFTNDAFVFLKKYDSAAQSPQFKQYWRTCAGAFLGLGDLENALICAKNYKSDSFKAQQTDETFLSPPESLSLLARVYAAKGNQTEFRKYTNDLIAYFKPAQKEALKDLKNGTLSEAYMKITLNLYDGLYSTGQLELALNVLVEADAELRKLMPQAPPQFEEALAAVLSRLQLKIYMLAAGLGKAELAEQAMAENMRLQQKYFAKKQSCIWVMQDYLQHLLRCKKFERAVKLASKLELISDNRILDAMDSPGHAFEGVLVAFQKKEDLKEPYESLKTKLIRLAHTELNRESPRMANISFILKELGACHERSSVVEICKLAQEHFPSGPEAASLEKLKAEALL